MNKACIHAHTYVHMKKDALLCKEIAFLPFSGVHEILVLYTSFLCNMFLT